MFLSKYFLPTLKDSPSDAALISHQLMIRAGMIRRLTSGIYEWLPLGLRVLQNVSEIVRQEMNKKGAIEVLLPSIQPISLWEKSGRYGSSESELQSEMLTMSDRHNNKLLFAPTAEEAICDMFMDNIQSYKNLPMTLYQVGWKFRDEVRPRYGVLRSREFLMKDAYSFDLTREDALITYDNMLDAYLRIYARMKLTAIPVLASSGDIGGDYSHELHVLAKTGESTIYYDENIIPALNTSNISIESLSQFYAREEEKHDVNAISEIAANIKQSKSIEVGHLFYLDDKYSAAMGAHVQTHDGEKIAAKMGCYGIGISRLVGAIIECHHDAAGIVWPVQVAPFKCIILNLLPDDAKCNTIATEIYTELSDANITALYDDTHDSSGVKFNRMDLIGIPVQVIIGRITIENNTVEVRQRITIESSHTDSTNISKTVGVHEAVNRCMQICLMKDIETTCF